ncbi:hypothetical protein K530_24648 [Streptomyces noursei CCRC 11814]|nr:hypothetical protein K530_24648 [Streptomyces noursei CCRC 11814]
MGVAEDLLGGWFSAQDAGDGLGERVDVGGGGLCGGLGVVFDRGADAGEEVGVGGAGLSFRLALAGFPCVQGGNVHAECVGDLVGGQAEVAAQPAAFGGRG